MKRELIDNPSIDHAWYKVIELYEQLKDYDFAKYIVSTVGMFASEIINSELIIDDVLKIKK